MELANLTILDLVFTALFVYILLSKASCVCSERIRKAHRDDINKILCEVDKLKAEIVELKLRQQFLNKD